MDGTEGLQRDGESVDGLPGAAGQPGGYKRERESNEALPNLEFSLKQQAKSQTTVLQTEAKNRQALPS